MALRLNNLSSVFGGRSALARLLVPQIVAQIATRQDHADHDLLKLAKHYGVDQAHAAHLPRALQIYYTAVVLTLTAFRCGQVGDWQQITSGAYFRQHNLLNVVDPQLALPPLDVAPLLEKAARLRFDDSPLDPLRPLYASLFPSALRHRQGEYYTPDWLIEFVLQRVGYDGSGSLLDPACGSGSFLRHAVQQFALDWQTVGASIAGIDRNPLACLSARANLVLLLGKPDQLTSIPIYCADSLLDRVPVGEFDLLAGNPPWVNWETMSPEYREQTRKLWHEYGLFAHRGMDIILGKGKKDLSALMTLVWAHRYLREGGRMSVILTETTLKSSAASGFRKLATDRMTLQLLQVDDLSPMSLFKGASTRSVILTLQKGSTTHYPVPYTLWHAHARLREREPLARIRQHLTPAHLLAEPIGADGSPLAAAKQGALQALRRLRGRSGYRAYAGVYTGGANAVYWLEVLEEAGELLRLRNIVAGAKRVIPQREAWIESALIYPLLRSGDVSRWSSTPSASILMVQDVDRRRGLDPDWLRRTYPYAYDWLAQFEPELRSRAAFRRYFAADAPFYSMFDVGHYSFSAHKVIWQGMGAFSMQAAVQETFAGKAVMSNQAVQPFMVAQHSDEAHYLAACLNNPLFDFAVICHGQAGAKSFAQPGILQHLYIPPYDAHNPDHQRMAAQSRQAHDGQPDEQALLQASAAIWGLPDHEVYDVLDSLRLFDSSRSG